MGEGYPRCESSTEPIERVQTHRALQCYDRRAWLIAIAQHAAVSRPGMGGIGVESQGTVDDARRYRVTSREKGQCRSGDPKAVRVVLADLDPRPCQAYRLGDLNIRTRVRAVGHLVDAGPAD